MDTTERNTGKVSPSTETNEVFSANTNNENTIGDEIMMDTTERGMASPCEKMEADLVIDWSNKLPQTADSGEGKKKYRMFVVTICGIAMRMIVTDEEKAKNPETAGRALWFCLKDACEGMGSADHMKQLRLIKEPDEANPKDSRLFTNSEIIFEDSKTAKMAVLANRGLIFATMIGLFQIISKTELDSVTVKEFQKELYERVLPSLALTGKAEISPEYAEKIGMDAPAGTQTLPDFTNLTRREILQMALDAEIAKEEAEKKLALSHQELDGEKEDHRHDNCVRNGRAGGLTKNRNFHQARADAAEARADEAEAKADEEKAKADELAIQLEIERGKWKTARDFCEPTRLNYSLRYLKWQVSRDLERVCEFLQEQSMLDVEPRPDGVMRFPKLAFDYLLHHFCVDPTYLQANRYDWLQELYKNGTISSVLGDPFAGEPDILKGLKHVDEETGKVYDLGESVSEYRLHPHATYRYGVFKYNDESNVKIENI